MRDCFTGMFALSFQQRKESAKENAAGHPWFRDFLQRAMAHPHRQCPSRRFLPSKLRLNVASTLRLTRSAAYCRGNVEVFAREAFCQL